MTADHSEISVIIGWKRKADPRWRTIAGRCVCTFPKGKQNYTTGSVTGYFGAGSAIYNRTWLKKAPDGHIYAVRNDGKALGRINQTNGQFQANAHIFAGGNRLNSYYTIPATTGNNYYYLPDDSRPANPLTATSQTTFTGSCGDATGTATITVTGGTPPYSYQWYKEPQWTYMSGYTSSIAQNLAAGSYMCIVTDIWDFELEVLVNITTDPNAVAGTMQEMEGTVSGQTRAFKEGLMVKTGKTLTLNNCNYTFYQDAKVIVEPGGKLVMNNTVFTACPGVMWKGVEVWGDTSVTQYPVNGICSQGHLIMRDSRIEHAISAVQLWKPNDYSKTGGIVQATNSIFRNNAKSIHALPYNNFHPFYGSTVIVNNLSFVDNCTFEITPAYIPDATFYKHIDLNKVKGIKISGSDFTVASIPGVDTYNCGIAAFDAGFLVSANCTNTTIPCNNYDPCNFNNFYSGVYTINVSSTNTFSVLRANFNNNAIGVYVGGVKNQSILFNTFKLGPNYGDNCTEGGSPSFGIDMVGSSGFAIEENTFQKASGAPVGQYVGIRCKDSKTTNDVIYKNQFTGLSYGNYAEGENRPSGSGYDYSGLQFQCNLNQNNAVDFIVAKDLTISNPPLPFIHTYQGKPELEAGNTFSANPMLYGSFMNMGTQVINYFYRTNPPVSFTPLLIVPIDNAGINTCPSHYGGGASGDLLVLSNEAKLQKETDFTSNLTNFSNVKALFDNLKDGGNTDGLKLDVETSWPTEMWDLRAELLEKSPHLSQEVLMAAADKTEVLPESILFEILSANPDELRKEELLAYLENKEQPLPDYLISILRQVAGGITYKTALLMDMATYQTNKTQAAYDLIRSALADSVTDYQYLRTWFGNLDNLQADYDMVAAYLAEGNYTVAQAMLESIPTARALEGSELAMFIDYKDLTLMQIGWEQQGIAITQLDSSTVAILEGYAESGTGKASLTARAILEYGYGYHFNCCLPENIPETLKRSTVNNSADGNGLQLSATPNPASTWVLFDYKLPIPATTGVLLITDMSGKAIASFNLKMPHGQQVWDTRGVSKGTYLYVLKAGNASKQGKIIVQ